MRIRIATLAGLLSLTSMTGSAAWANHIAREDPPEPIFTERAFVENDLEIDVDVDHAVDGNAVGLSPSVTWIFFRRLQLGAEIPVGWTIPDVGGQEVALGDVGFSAKWLFCCDREMGFAFFSTRVDVAAPSGDRAEGIGGTGELTISLLGGYGLTVVRALDDLGIQVQLAWDQQLRAEQGGGVAEKGVLWNVAFSQPLFGGRFIPTFEVLGTSVVEATSPSDERTQLSLAPGFQLRPFPDDSWASPITLSGGYRFPVLDRGDDRGSAAMSVEWAFD